VTPFLIPLGFDLFEGKRLPLDDHFQIKKSQAFLVENVPVFIKNSKNEFVLYKSENIKRDSAKYHDDSLPDLFIRKTD